MERVLDRTVASVNLVTEVVSARWVRNWQSQNMTVDNVLTDRPTSTVRTKLLLVSADETAIRCSFCYNITT